MNSRLTIQEELNSLNSSLPNNIGMPPFSVPEGYFDAFAASVLMRLNQESKLSARAEIEQLSPLLAGISRQSPFSVPEGFFESSFKAITSFTEDESSAILAQVGKKMPYQVPEGYFDNLSSQVMSKVKPQAKVIPMNARRWMRMAVAAVVAGIITVSGIVYFSGRKEIAIDNPQWVANKLQNVSDKELEEFVKTTDVNQSATASIKTSAIRSGEVKRLLQDVPDNELNAFLDQVPSDDLETSLN